MSQTPPQDVAEPKGEATEGEEKEKKPKKKSKGSWNRVTIFDPWQNGQNVGFSGVWHLKAMLRNITSSCMELAMRMGCHMINHSTLANLSLMFEVDFCLYP